MALYESYPKRTTLFTNGFFTGGERGGRVYLSTIEHTLHNIICVFFT
jgi:hypothetical protein